MTILSSTPLSVIISSEKKARKKLGAQYKKFMALIRRLEEISAKEIFSLSGNPHRLSFQPKDLISVTLVHPFRCILRVTGETVTLVEITNYHDHGLKQYKPITQI